MLRIEKTIFLCYRRTNIPWALAIFQYLTRYGFDVFFDFPPTGSAPATSSRSFLGTYRHGRIFLFC